MENVVEKFTILGKLKDKISEFPEISPFFLELPLFSMLNKLDNVLMIKVLHRFDLGFCQF